MWILLVCALFLHGGLTRVLTLVQDSLGREETTCTEVVGLEQVVEFIIVYLLRWGRVMWWIVFKSKLFRMCLQVLLGEMRLRVLILRLEI